MMRHRLRKHDVPMECAVCDKKFTLVEDFEKHNKNDHLQHTCDLCGLKFNTKLALQNHVAAKHEEHIPCPQCGVMFATKYTLASHIGTTHGEFALQKCSECDYSTRNASEMKKHFERKHTENLQETCEFCGSVFKNLKKHLQRTGCGQENFTKKKTPCPHCPKTFALGTEMTAHIKKIHDRVKDKLCPHCSYATYSGYNLKLHISKMHLGGKLVKQPCPFCDVSTTNVDYHIEIYHAGKTTTEPLALQ